MDIIKKSNSISLTINLHRQDRDRNNDRESQEEEMREETTKKENVFHNFHTAPLIQYVCKSHVSHTCKSEHFINTHLSSCH